MIYDEPICATNPSTQSPIHDTAPDIPLKTFTLRFKYIDEVSMYRSTL